MARPARVGGLRTSVAVQEDDEKLALPNKKQDVYQFRSKAASLRLSLRRRRTNRDNDGVRYDDIPRCTDGHDAALDWVFFENHNYETKCHELAALVRKAPGFGVGREFWSLDDETKAHEFAKEREFRAFVEANPKIADRVLRPSDSEDFVLPPPPVA